VYGKERKRGTPDRVDVMEIKMLQLLLREMLNASAQHLIAGPRKKANAKPNQYLGYFVYTRIPNSLYIKKIFNLRI